jgi:hypothetical protein
MRPLSIIGRGRDFLIAAEDAIREKWIVSSAYFKIPTCGAEKIFQLHRPGSWEPGIDRIRGRLVVAWDAPGYEACERLPVELLIERFGRIFASSISWMLAYALLLGYQDIALCGVDMQAQGEYGPQRDYLFYLMGLAKAQANIIIPKTSGLWMPPIAYGIREDRA